LSGKLWIALVNIDPTRPARIAAWVPGTKVRSAAGQVLSASAVDAHNSFDRPNQVVPRPFAGRVAGGRLVFDLAPKSIAVVQVE
jgi:alpha-N-arabinofuranosidase